MRRTTAGRWSAVLVAAALLNAAACGSDSGGAIAVTDLRAALVPALCHQAVLCGEYPDAETCATNQQEEPHFFASLPQLVAAGRIAYDGQKARRCVDQLNALQSCRRQVVRVPGAFADCQGMLTGQVAAGQPCFFEVECPAGGGCQSTPNCDSFTTCCASTCLPAPNWVQAGGDCASSSNICASGTVCAVSADGMSATCQPPGVTVGVSCASIPCAASLYCDSSTHTCQAPAPEGGGCNPSLNDRDCDDPRDHCDSTATCVPRLPVRAACDPAHNACVSWAKCDATTFTCAPLPHVGESCETGTTPLACLGGVRCDADTHTCTLLPVGGSCL